MLPYEDCDNGIEDLGSAIQGVCISIINNYAVELYLSG
jgi:hypothetical protein